jgi:multicomponent Na+:H+ antiporter subunit G
VNDLLIIFFLITGALFSLISAVGIVKFPDVFTRMHASAKAGTLGAACILTSAAIYFRDGVVALEVSIIIVFLVLTTPVAAHMISRVAYRVGVPLWKGSVMDEPRDRKDSSD